ncbi:MAG: hypothetical protein UV82_C0007G0008 [Candidatus Magasanikbacteria bacterium GW2011_GWD2_43_18]|nr:MAG: hypothetical protein UV18_C0009G0014 [Candidatus Magasanikbacteria bacterium GW2011_GWC2_42_27]KKT04508.1 MAG: hypothetical protein UV82_C0007G0008 [Candidatus Magasanikbacteria bacterium GW2011_GWD2_43_18]
MYTASTVLTKIYLYLLKFVESAVILQQIQQIRADVHK